MSIPDGSVVWQKDFLMGLRKLPLVIGYNHKKTYTSSGTFIAPITGLYKITLQGGGGGGKSAASSCGGGGGGAGGQMYFYANLIAGTSYSFTVGAGGNGGNSPTSGGTTSITLGDNTYSATGGNPGSRADAMGSQGDIVGISYGGRGGVCKINNSNVPGTEGVVGGIGFRVKNALGVGGSGGGYFGGPPLTGSGYVGWYGSGGSGGGYDSEGGHQGKEGGGGYITIEWFDPADAFPSIWAEIEPST